MNPLLFLSLLGQAVAISLHLSVPASPPILPNPIALPPTTHATLSRAGESQSASLSPQNTFTFHNLTAPASYLLDVHTPSVAFIPFRVDIAEDGSIWAWETYRGNDWGNKGEAVHSRDFGDGLKGFEVRPAGKRAYFVERSKFNLVNIVMKNPMILMGGVTMIIFLGMPYLMKNMDPEMRAEFEARQRENPLSGLLSGQAGGQGGPAAPNFDIAGFLAGGQSSGSGPQQQQQSSSGCKKGKR